MALTALILEEKFLTDIAPGDTSLFYSLLEEADMKLLEQGKWAWTRTPLDLTPVAGVVTLPAEYVSIVGCTIGSTATGVLWQEIEYIEGGTGVIPMQGCNGQLLDKGLVAGVRTYRCTGSDPDAIVVLARYAPRSISAPSDTTLCPSYIALKQAMLSIVYENADDAERSRLYLQMALDTLDKKEVSYRGSAKKVFNPRIYGAPKRRSNSNFP